MYITTLRINNFRNIPTAELSLSEGFNIFVGENAQGKTNTAEAIELVLTGRSHRESLNENFIKDGQPRAALSAEAVLENGAGYLAECTVDSIRGKAHRINGELIRSRSRLNGYFAAVFFSPEDLRIVSDSPQIRRSFLNDAISQLYPRYSDMLSDYGRVVKQRNLLLKDWTPSCLPMLEVYDEQLADLGSDIMRRRIAFLKECQGVASDLYRFISGEREDISLNYISNVITRGGVRDIRSEYMDALSASREDDIYSRTTTVGVHHDDIAIFISGKPARKFASRGQLRSIAICMKFSLIRMLLARREEKAVVILDDIMSELDENRRAKVVEMLSGYQVFITCVSQDFDTKDNETKVFTVSSGVITEKEKGE